MVELPANDTASLADSARRHSTGRAIGRDAPVAYDAFISYSHAKDKPVATALQSVVQKLGKAWYRRRALRLFRDDTSLSATPHLWPSIEQALSQSRFLILLASPEAAASHWVGQEIAYWLDHNSADTVLIALTDGELDWDQATGDFRWSEATPLPTALKNRFSAEPRWIDLRPYRDGAPQKASNSLGWAPISPRRSAGSQKRICSRKKSGSSAGLGPSQGPQLRRCRAFGCSGLAMASCGDTARRGGGPDKRSSTSAR